MTTPFDPGLQPERTELAWRRTALAIGLGSLVTLRLLPAALGSPWWVLVGVLGLLVAVTLWVAGRRRMQYVNAVLASHGDRGRMPGAGPLAALALFVFATAALATAVVLLA
ncbi:DUF202 domain-containing protein [Microbacterium sp. AK031]|uniref:DUF202 domain-containing protein n=1 Tax=Microbacterium sp. AK031 TaxID=2723076 RepID=UPI00216979CA|nr:DUF202 domain-containing protein [Microbacterium sp. AK031]MCS3842368.1 uncharacterized membrane protein YidH (DUF202 family) [Microbacterium sp. AK031]